MFLDKSSAIHPQLATCQPCLLAARWHSHIPIPIPIHIHVQWRRVSLVSPQWSWKFRRNDGVCDSATRVTQQQVKPESRRSPEKEYEQQKYQTRTCILPERKVELQKVATEQNETCKVWVTCRILSTERCSKRMSNVPAIGSEGLSRRWRWVEGLSQQGEGVQAAVTPTCNPSPQP